MQVSGTVLAAMYIGAVYGIAWSDRTRFLTFNLAGILFFLNLFTEIGGPYSWDIMFLTVGTILGAYIWIVGDILASIIAVLNAALTNATTDDEYIHVPDTSTTNLKDVFFASDDGEADHRRPPRP
jgi:hypothetical protein